MNKVLPGLRKFSPSLIYRNRYVLQLIGRLGTDTFDCTCKLVRNHVTFCPNSEMKSRICQLTLELVCDIQRLQNVKGGYLL